MNLSEVHLKMRTRKRRLSGPPYNKKRKFREFFFVSLPCGTKARGEEGEKLDDQWDTRQRAILYPNCPGPWDFGNNRSYNKKQTNRYGRVLFGKTSVSPNVVREEIRYLNRSYNKKQTNRYGRVLFGKTSVSPNVVREEIRYLNRSYNKKQTNQYGRVLFGKTSVSPNVVREEIRYLNRSFNKKTNNQGPGRRAISYPKC